MLTIATSVAEFIACRNPNLAKLWTITRTDGEVLRFTGHDKTIPHQGNDFSPAGGFDASADRLEGALKEHNKSIKGLIASDRIKLDDLMAGLYDDAAVVEDLVDWRFPWLGNIYTRRWWVDSVRFDGEYHEAEMSGPTRLLRNQVGAVCSRTCGHKLGEFNATTGIGCTVDVAAGYTDSSVTILGTLDANKRMTIVIDSGSLGGSRADGWFDDGKIVFLDGANAGHTLTVKRWTTADSKLVLQEEAPFEIEANATCDLIAGCDRLRTTCRDKFGNIVEFSGFPFMPFVDRALGASQP